MCGNLIFLFAFLLRLYFFYSFYYKSFRFWNNIQITVRFGASLPRGENKFIFFKEGRTGDKTQGFVLARDAQPLHYISSPTNSEFKVQTVYCVLICYCAPPHPFMYEIVILLSWVFRIRDQSFPPLKLGLFQAFGLLCVVLPTFSHVALKYPHQTSGPCLVLCSGAGSILQTKLWFPTSFLVPKHLFWVQLDDKKKCWVSKMAQ